MCPSGNLRSSISSFKSAFDALDGDGDGRISPSDLRAFVDDDGVVESMIAEAGGGEKGFVELEEFERVVSGRGKKKKKRVSIMEEVFGEMDVDKDGVVGFGDLKAYLRGVVGMDIADDEVREMIAIGGGDRVGGVCFDGLVRILTVGGGSKRC